MNRYFLDERAISIFPSRLGSSTGPTATANGIRIRHCLFTAIEKLMQEGEKRN